MSGGTSRPLNCIGISGSSAYAGGSFTSIGGKTRRYLAAFDATTGRATAWNPNPNSSVSAIAISGATVYAGGSFDSIGGQWRRYIGAVDTGTGNATTWDPSNGDINGGVQALAVSGSTVYAGGSFWWIAGQQRYFLVAIDSTTGSITSWDPAPNGGISALAVDGSTVYALGGFNTLDCINRNQ